MGSISLFYNKIDRIMDEKTKVLKKLVKKSLEILYMVKKNPFLPLMAKLDIKRGYPGFETASFINSIIRLRMTLLEISVPKAIYQTS
jgi:hypothetical protein